DKKESFCDNTVVQFSALRQEEIEWYVDHGNPFDKSGGYGVQDWIGHIGIERIEGSFFNVMGLPVEKLYCRLRDFA
ncbi:MAG: Maf family protein, partial [Flavobacteriales bacterium]